MAPGIYYGLAGRNSVSIRKMKGFSFLNFKLERQLNKFTPQKKTGFLQKEFSISSMAIFKPQFLSFKKRRRNGKTPLRKFRSLF